MASIESLTSSFAKISLGTAHIEISKKNVLTNVVPQNGRLDLIKALKLQFPTISLEIYAKFPENTSDGDVKEEENHIDTTSNIVDLVYDETDDSKPNWVHRKYLGTYNKIEEDKIIVHLSPQSLATFMKNITRWICTSMEKYFDKHKRYPTRGVLSMVFTLFSRNEQPDIGFTVKWSNKQINV